MFLEGGRDMEGGQEMEVGQYKEASIVNHYISQIKTTPEGVVKFGGARRDRTVDLNTASVALSQLSYGPKFCSLY